MIVKVSQSVQIKIMIRILTLLVLLMVSSCKKDELIPSNTVTTPKIIKITKMKLKALFIPPSLEIIFKGL